MLCLISFKSLDMLIVQQLSTSRPNFKNSVSVKMNKIEVSILKRIISIINYWYPIKIIGKYGTDRTHFICWIEKM